MSSSAHPRRRAPRPLALALERLGADLAPATPLARIQAAWGPTVGEAIATAARPTAERSGVVTVSCSAAVWAQELELMGPALAVRINAALGEELVTGLRCRVA